MRLTHQSGGTIKKFVRLVGALLAIALIPAGAARADTADDAFVKALADQGITGDPDQLIAAGHGVCDNVSRLATGPPRWARFSALGPVMGELQINAWQAGFVISAAENAYCPQYLGLR